MAKLLLCFKPFGSAEDISGKWYDSYYLKTTEIRKRFVLLKIAQVV